MQVALYDIGHLVMLWDYIMTLTLYYIIITLCYSAQPYTNYYGEVTYQGDMVEMHQRQ